jgi:hypothetical protein
VWWDSASCCSATTLSYRACDRIGRRYESQALSSRRMWVVFGVHNGRSRHVLTAAVLIPVERGKKHHSHSFVGQELRQGSSVSKVSTPSYTPEKQFYRRIYLKLPSEVDPFAYLHPFTPSFSARTIPRTTNLVPAIGYPSS